MPRDSRPYVTYPIGYTTHPRIELLSDKAFRAFHEMTDYCRQNLTDGWIDRRIAEKRWSKKVLHELIAGVDDRPLVVLDGDRYLQRSYSEHQMTAADVEDLRAKRAEAGRKGGQARASAKASAKQIGTKTEAESKSESKSVTDVTYDSESSHVGDAPELEPDPITPVALLASRAGIGDLASMRNRLEQAVGQPVSPRGAIELAKGIAAKSRTPVKDLDAYVAVTCRNSAAEIQQAYFDLDIEAFNVGSVAS